MCATSVIQPIDMVKVRIQLASELGGQTNPFKVAAECFQTSGVKGFYAGLDSALLRQAVYATMRLGIYFNLSEHFKMKNGGDLSFLQKVGCSLTAGCLGSCVATPCDLVLVRMQADKRPGILDSERRNYTNVFNAFSRIVADEGATSLYTGALATMTRAMVLNMFMLVSYDQSKEMMAASMPDASTRKISIYASLVSSVFTSAGTLPFDNVKTKVQNQKANAEGVKPYAGMVDCA